MKKWLLTFGLFLPCLLSAQTVSGTVVDFDGEALAGVGVYWVGTSVGVTTDARGDFEILVEGITDLRLTTQYVGHSADTVSVTDPAEFVVLVLAADATLDEVTVEGRRDGIVISDANAIKTEQITEAELGKAACCDLAGCFETQVTVQPQTTNVITNSKELRILGLSGVYNQVLIDGFPMIQGLTYTYGISSIPGTLVDNIYVSKGANSVLQGFESMSGQINVETKDPDDTDRLFVNGYVNNFLEKHFSANYAFRKGKWSNLTTVFVVQPADRVDRDNDNFLDLPLLTRYAVVNKWQYGDERELGWSSSVGVRYLNEARVGGQVSFDAKTDQGSTRVYGQTVDISQPEIWTKNSYRFDEAQRLALYVSAFHQNQHSFFGSVGYAARQSNLYANLQYERDYRTHSLKTGVSHRYLKLDETIRFTDDFLPRTYAGDYRRLEHITGVFAENTFRLLDNKLTWIVGLRGDHHNQFGFRATPRTLLKYDFAPKTIVRANFGTGWRTVNLFSENIGLLVSSRDIIFAEPLEPERAVNYGINLTQKFDTDDGKLSGYFSADFYRTDFQNQIFPDYDTDPRKAIIENFRGTSVSNGFQAEVFLDFLERFELKAGYNFLDVYRMNGEVKQLLPFNARHKVLTTFSYRPLSDRYHFDANVHWYGRQRLPNTRANPTEFRRPDFSQPFTTFNAQFTYNFPRLEVYAGCENIFDFRQLRPIISWQDPFSPFFDTSSVWGPTRGRETYLGLRFRLEN